VSLDISIALRAEQDLTLQYRWYIENAGHAIAESYLTAVHETILKIAEWPDIGCRRHFRAPELIDIRSITAKKPFDRHLIFYKAEKTILIARIMHGARNLPIRLTEDP
jgi:plasmid stabilization system protein ParE